MQYTLEMQGVEQNIAKQAKQANQPLPDRIANAPVLHSGNELYLNAFFDLDTDRYESFMRIPWSKINAYAMFHSFDEEQTARLQFFIRKMDSFHLERMRVKLKNGANT